MKNSAYERMLSEQNKHEEESASMLASMVFIALGAALAMLLTVAVEGYFIWKLYNPAPVTMEESPLDEPRN